MRYRKYFIILAFMFVLVEAYAQVDQIPLVAFSYNQPTLKLEGEELANKNRMLRFSVVTGYRQGVKPIRIDDAGIKLGVYRDKATGTSRIAMFNISIQDMLTDGKSQNERVILNVKDPSKYRYDKQYGNEDDWLRKNGFCYEIALPSNAFPLDSIFDFVRTDVAYQFNVKAVKEKRMTDDQHRYGLAPGEPNREVEVIVISELNTGI